jgi:regulator of protease activity HflC (stomatin/prohibitin superfamily)
MKTINFLMAGLVTVSMLSSCKNKTVYHRVSKIEVKEIRLGDGVPLCLGLSVRWTFTDEKSFNSQFKSVQNYDSLIMLPRCREIVSNVSNTFPSIDSVFTGMRESYIQSVKNALQSKLGKDDIVVKEIIVSNIRFPQSFTESMEKVGLKERELELIRQQKALDVEKAKADEERALANGKVSIAQAQMDGKVEQINAEMEKQRRLNAIAKAETEAQLSDMNAKAEAEKNLQLGKAEAEKKRMLAKVDVEKEQDLKELAVQNQEKLNKVAFKKEMDYAKLCTENPAYATFLVNKEMASKVQIAVLPTGTDGGMIRSLLQSSPTTNKSNRE